MTKSTPFEQLDQAVEAILARAESPLGANTKLEPLARVARELRGLPNPDFKARLKADLGKQIAMTTAVETTTKTPAGQHYQALTPFIRHDRAPELAEFVERAFGAEELSRNSGSAGDLHIEIRIGDAVLMFGGGGKAKIDKPTPTRLHLYVKDADVVYRQALAAGATSIYEPVDQAYGDREAGVRDMVGNEWFIATRRGPTYIPEGFRTVTPGMQAKGADRAIEFLKNAFGAEDAGTYRSPEGIVVHGVMRIGDSILELGEAHGRWQPMPTAFYLMVKDADSTHKQALRAGATSTSEPADQPWGHRMAGVLDPFGNQWFIASPLGK